MWFIYFLIVMCFIVTVLTAINLIIDMKRFGYFKKDNDNDKSIKG